MNLSFHLIGSTEGSMDGNVRWLVGHFCPNHFGPVGYMLTNCQFHLVQGRFLSACACVVILWFEKGPTCACQDEWSAVAGDVVMQIW